MHKLLTMAALALVLGGIHTGVLAQAPAQEPAQRPVQEPEPAREPVVVTPKLNLTLEQRHVIKEFIKDVNAPPAASNAAPAIGDAIPQNVNVQPMPNEVGQKVPQVKTHNFFLAGGLIVIVDPKDNKVADIIKLSGD